VKAVSDHRHILIVGDIATEALVLRRLLERHGYRATVVGTGLQALAHVEKESVVLLPFTGAAEAFAMAERIRTAVAGTAWDRRPVTVSIGIACAGEKTKTFDDLIAAADAALYKSKETGRNRATAA
jgi:PleD family two-component response regulator